MKTYIIASILSLVAISAEADINSSATSNISVAISVTNTPDYLTTLPNFDVVLSGGSGEVYRGQIPAGSPSLLGNYPAGLYTVEISSSQLRFTSDSFEVGGTSGAAFTYHVELDLTNLTPKLPEGFQVTRAEWDAISEAIWEGYFESIQGTDTRALDSYFQQITPAPDEGVGRESSSLRVEDAPFSSGNQTITYEVVSSGTVPASSAYPLEVRLVDSVTFLPIAGATVTVGPYTRVTDSSGRTAGIIPRDVYAVSLSAPGYAAISDIYVHDAERVFTIPLTLLPGANSPNAIPPSTPPPASQYGSPVTIHITKAGGKGRLFGSYGNPNCPNDIFGNPGNECYLGTEQNRYLSVSVEADAGYRFVGWSGDPECSSFGRELIIVQKDLNCTATFASGTPAPTACLAPGTVCGSDTLASGFQSQCNRCCEYNPNDPYNRTYDYNGYTLSCSGTQVTGAATLILSSNAIFADESLRVDFSNPMPSTTTDWIGVFSPGAANDSAPIDYVYANTCTKLEGQLPLPQGSCSFRALQTGQYELRMYQHNHYIRLGTSSAFTVKPIQPSLSFSGGADGNQPLQAGYFKKFTVGVFRLNVAQSAQFSLVGAAGGGKGGDTYGSNLGGGGGGGGAVTNGTAVTLVPGHNYTLVVGAGGSYFTYADGQATTLIDSTTGTTLVSLAGGNAGYGQARGMGGTVLVGQQGVTGGYGGYGGVNYSSSDPGAPSPLGAGGGGGGGFYDPGDSVGVSGGAGGQGVLAGTPGWGGGNSAVGGPGGDGGGASFSLAPESYGYGGAGNGARGGAGHNGGNGVAVFVFTPAPQPPSPALPPLTDDGGPAPADLNGDGKPDLLFQRPSDDQIAYWLMNGVNSTTQAFFPGSSNPDIRYWRLVGAADLNGDGKNDLLWQHRTSGDIVYWLMNGENAIGGAFFPETGPGLAPWRLVGTADLNGDGKPDLLWQNRNTGDITYWLMNGVTSIAQGWFPATGPGLAPWRLVGAADLNGDGKPDLLWQNRSTGEIGYWLMNGVNAITMANFTDSSPGLIGWRLVGAADFNSDGKPDLLWQNRVTGEIGYWFLNAFTATQAGNFPDSVPGLSAWSL